MIELCIDILSKIGSLFMDFIIWKKENIDPIIKKYLYIPVKSFLDPRLNYPIMVIKEDEIINKYCNISQIKELVYDFVIKKEGNDYIIIHDVSNYESLRSEIPSYNIMSIVLYINNEQFEISLKKPNNYMVIGNVLNHQFFKFYMKTTYNIIIDSTYTIKFIDNKMNFKECNSTNSLVITKNGILIQ